MLLGERPQAQELAYVFIEGLGLAEQAGLPVVLRGGEGLRGPPGYLVGEAAGQPLSQRVQTSRGCPVRARARGRRGAETCCRQRRKRISLIPRLEFRCRACS